MKLLLGAGGVVVLLIIVFLLMLLLVGSRELTEAECLAEGGIVLNTLGNDTYTQEYRVLGTVEGSLCPCVCAVER